MHIHVGQRSTKPIGLIAVIVVHILIAAMWRQPSRHEAGGLQRESTLYLLPPRTGPRAQEQAAPAPPVQPPARPRIRPDPQPITPTTPQAAAEVPVEPEAPMESELTQAETNTGAPSLLDRSLKLAGGIDKELRKESWYWKDREIAHEPKLAQAIAAAYRDRSFNTIDIPLANGDILSKIRTPFGTYCVRINGNRPTAGRDPFRDSGKLTFVRCP